MNNSLNILVTGANGQLGNEIRIISKTRLDNYIFTDVVTASKESISILKKLGGEDTKSETILLDITNLSEIMDVVKKENINVIVNCAAYTNVDAAEENLDLSESINSKAPENLAIAMKEVNGLLVHISTDYVFGGDPYNTPCKENQKGTPTGVYGLTKLHGEQNIQAIGVDYIILRTAWLYSEFGKNFVKTMLSLISTKPQLKVVFDQVGTPTYALELAKAITLILEDYKQTLNSQHSTLNYAKSGIYHFSNEGVCSWFDFSKMIAFFSGNIGCDILPCHSSEFPSKVMRPSYSVLDKSKIKDVFRLKILYWTDSLRQCIDNIIKL